MTDAEPVAFDPTDHLLPPAHKATPVGPTAGVIIILVLLMAAAVYFWGQHANQKNNPENKLPLIPADNSVPVSTTQ